MLKTRNLELETSPHQPQIQQHRLRRHRFIYMNTRYYLPGVGRFLSADTVVPDPQDPQSYNRYSYALNNPVKYTDPSGHCVFIPPYDTAACIALLALTLTGDTQHTPFLEAPQNITFGDVNMPCEYQLATCFAYEVPGVEEPIVWLKNFEGYNEANPLPLEEFVGLLNAVAEDLYTHSTPSPGWMAGRGIYDTPFYNGGGRGAEPPEGLWPADQ